MTAPPAAVPHDELLALAANLAVEAGRMVRDGRAERGIHTTDTKSSSTDMVTEFDRASEALIVSAIRSERPHDAIIGEEGTDTSGTSGISWLVDPIDGTTNFLYGLPGYAVSIAASSAEGTEVGAVYIPATDELFTAARGRGAQLGGQPIRCNDPVDVSVALVATGFAYDRTKRAAMARRAAELLPRVRDIRRLGAASADLCHVAAGRIDVYYEEHLGPWDLAAGELIAREAGCRSGSLDGGPVRPSSVLVAAPGLFESMRALIADIDAHL